MTPPAGQYHSVTSRTVTDGVAALTTDAGTVRVVERPRFAKRDYPDPCPVAVGDRVWWHDQDPTDVWLEREVGGDVPLMRG